MIGDRRALLGFLPKLAKTAAGASVCFSWTLETVVTDTSSSRIGAW
jgi:hypothetical protein